MSPLSTISAIVVISLAVAHCSGSEGTTSTTPLPNSGASLKQCVYCDLFFNLLHFVNDATFHPAVKDGLREVITTDACTNSSSSASLLNADECNFLLASDSTTDGSNGGGGGGGVQTNAPTMPDPLDLILSAVRDSLGDLYEEMASRVLNCPTLD